MRTPLAAAAITAALSLSACAYGGYPGVSVGYGNYGGYNGGYYDPYYNGYSPYGYQSVGYGGYGYGSPFGWYDGFYYPGSGYYVYDTYRRPHMWNDRQRQYWVRLRPQATNGATTTAVASPNWSGFNRPRQTGNNPGRAERVSTRTTDQQARLEQRTQAREDRENARLRRRR